MKITVGKAAKIKSERTKGGHGRYETDEELGQDVLSIISVFSSKLYGSRSHKNKTVVETANKLFEGPKDENCS